LPGVSYTYDPVGNRLSSLGVSPYSVNVSNQLTSTPNTIYSYDYNGNTQTKVVGTNTTSYSWDFENRLASVTLPGFGGTVAFDLPAGSAHGIIRTLESPNWPVAQTLNPKTLLGAAYAGLACAGLDSTSCQAICTFQHGSCRWMR